MDIMLDTETWGTTPGSDIRSIGACVFVPHTGAVCTPDHIQTQTDYPHGTFYIACDNPGLPSDEAVTIGPDGNYNRNVEYPYYDMNGYYRRYPLTRDPQTVQWWSEQSDEAQGAFADPVDLGVALGRFSDWLHRLMPVPTEHPRLRPLSNIRLWSHGAAFDPPILAAAYEAVGLPIPWHYRAPRDTRTLFDAAGIEDHSALLARHPGPMGVSHHALDDSICQARAVCAAYNRLRSPDREFHVGRIAMQQYASWTNQSQDIGGAWAEIERAIQET